MADRSTISDAEIEVTPEMIEAGRRAYYDYGGSFLDPGDLAAVIYEEMAIADKRRPHRGGAAHRKVC